MFRAVDANCNCDLQSSSVFTRCCWLVAKIVIHRNTYLHQCWDSVLRCAIATQKWFCLDVKTLIWLQHNVQKCNDILWTTYSISMFQTLISYWFRQEYSIVVSSDSHHTMWFLHKNLIIKIEISIQSYINFHQNIIVFVRKYKRTSNFSDAYNSKR